LHAPLSSPPSCFSDRRREIQGVLMAFFHTAKNDGEQSLGGGASLGYRDCPA
jgi:hypothetical protein